tara:strand:+ start:788 stop:1867 length:1080 start_codon:yes stop_codon:yes gene_type:complete
MKVCVIGDSLSGITLAKALVNQNIYVDVVSEKKSKKISKTRTIGISKSNIDFFNKNIINIEKFLWKLNKIEIYSENLKNEKLINFKNKYNHLFSIIRNHELYQVLIKSLLKNKYFNRKLFFKKDLKFFDDYGIIINCDSSHPFSRKYFSKNLKKKYNSLAFTTIIKHKRIKNNIASQIFTKKGPLAFLPISNTETSVVYSINKSNNVKKENIEYLIQKYNLKYKINKIEKIVSFELSSLNLRNYSYKNILAFGDLLHRVHPLAGQGFNMTIRDIKILLNLIKNRIDLGLSLDSSINDEFEKSLKHKNFIFSNGIDLIQELFNIERKIKSNIFSKSTKYFFKIPAINKVVTKIADKGVLL